MSDGRYKLEEMPDAARHMEWSEPYSIVYRLDRLTTDGNLDLTNWMDNLTVSHSATIYEMAGMETDPHYFAQYMVEKGWTDITPDYDGLEKEGTD